MKNYNEMAQSVLSRISEYETVKKRKKKIKSLCEYMLKKDIYRVDHRIFEM